MKALIEWIQNKLGKGATPGEAETLARFFWFTLRTSDAKEPSPDDARTIIGILTLLFNGVQPADGGAFGFSGWFSYWQGVLSQMHRGNWKAQDIIDLFTFLGNNPSSLTGLQMQRLFMAFRTHPPLKGKSTFEITWLNSDVSGRVIQQLAQNPSPLSPQDILTLVTALLANPFSLTPLQIAQLINILRSDFTPVFTPQQVQTLLNAMAAFLQGAAVSPSQFIVFMKKVAEAKITPQAVLQAFGANYAPLNPPQVMSLFGNVGYTQTISLTQWNNNVLNGCTVLSNAIGTFSRGVSDLIDVILCAIKGNVPLDQIPLILQLVPGLSGDARFFRDRICGFISHTCAAIKGLASNGRDWPGVLQLVQQFITQGRNGAILPVFPPVQVLALNNGLSLRIPSGRQHYFMVAHTLSFFDFDLGQRAENITCWPTATGPGIINWITGIATDPTFLASATEASEGEEDEGAETNNLAVEVGDFEVRMIRGDNPQTVVLIHFMPAPEAPQAIVISRELVVAIQFLFVPLR